MAKYTINYERKIQVRPYEMLTIGLVAEFEGELTGKEEALGYVSETVNRWIEEERARL